MKKTFLQIAVLLLLVAAVPFAYVLAAPNIHMGRLFQSSSSDPENTALGDDEPTGSVEGIATPTEAPTVVTVEPTPEPTLEPTIDPNAPDVTSGATVSDDEDEDDEEDDDEEEDEEDDD